MNLSYFYLSLIPDRINTFCGVGIANCATSINYKKMT